MEGGISKKKKEKKKREGTLYPQNFIKFTSYASHFFSSWLNDCTRTMYLTFVDLTRTSCGLYKASRSFGMQKKGTKKANDESKVELRYLYRGAD
jgi:hypothetical protein